MADDASPKRSLAWPRWMGWLVVIAWVLGILAILGHREFLRRGHDKVDQLLASSRPAPPKALPRGAAPGPGAAETGADQANRGTPVTELPFIGPALAGDPQAIADMNQVSKDMRSFLGELANCSEDGVIDFRALLAAMGFPVPESMTEAEAAAEFVRRADRFAHVLTQWRAAVAQGPWDFSAIDFMKPEGSASSIFNFGISSNKLLGALTQAHLAMGNSDTAWREWQSMRLAADRMAEAGILMSALVATRSRELATDTFHAGLVRGGWTNAQLEQVPSLLATERPIDDFRRGFEGEKQFVEQYVRAMREDPKKYGPSEGPELFGVNWITLLTTEQQIADNTRLMNHVLDEIISRFDPATGFYTPPPPGEIDTFTRIRESDSWFDQFYLAYARVGMQHGDIFSDSIIEGQSRMDQTRLAAALESHRRATGAYPESLESLGSASGPFAGGLPLDIATGQPYFYQRTDDGGYTLRGTGRDQQIDAAETKKGDDITWTHRPRSLQVIAPQ